MTGKKAILDIPEAYGAKGSTYDDMFKAFADPETPYADWSLVPDKTLTQVRSLSSVWTRSFADG